MKYLNTASKAAIIALGITAITMPASAQVLDEIVTTAQKRTESVQDVPISIQVLSGDDIKAAGALDFQTLSDSLPNVDISSAPGIRRVTIRGLGSGPGNPAFEQSVGLYVDGVYASRIDLFQEPFLDVERIEVLKGPQGVLLGKNSVAGALSIHSAKPTDTFEGYVEGGYEFLNNSYYGIGVVSGPLTDTLSGRLAAKYVSTGDYLDNESVGPDGIETESITLRGSLLWEPSENTEVYLKGEYSDNDDSGSPFQLVGDLSPGSVPSLFLEGGPGAVLPANSGVNGLTVPIFFGTVAGGEDFTFDDTQFFDGDLGLDQETISVTLQVTHDIGDHEIVYLGAYAGFDRVSVVDNDFSGVNTLLSESDRDFDQQSHELRIVSPKGKTIEYVAGLYFLDRSFDIASTTDAFGSFLPPAFPVDISASAFSGYSEDSQHYAAFGQVTWNIADNFRVSVGGRYSEEDKEASNSEVRFDFETTQPLATGTPEQQAKDFLLTNVFGFGPTAFSIEETINESSFDPTVNVQWNVNDDILTYASWTQATKAGGFDSGEGNGNIEAFTFEEEVAQGFELGAKMTLLGGRARLNAAIFRTEFDDLQVSSFDPTIGAVGAFVTGNAAEATTQGIEVDGLFAVTDKLTIGGSGAYLDAKYDDFNVTCPANALEAATLNCVLIDGRIQQSLDGFRIENAPEWTGTAFAEYFTTIGGLNAGGRVDINYKSETSLDVSQDSNLIEGGYAKVNLNLSLATPDDRWSGSLGVFNLTNQQPSNFGGQAFSLPGVYFLNRIRGREIKASVTRRF